MRQELYNKAIAATTCQEFAECFISGCNRCSLSEHDNHPVIYRGNPSSKIMLIGEAPGAKEDANGRPFSGPAGQLLDRIFRAVDIDTDNDMFLTNIVYCRPVAPKYSGKQNYTPKKDQIIRCMPFTDKLIEIINPDILIACGGPALQSLMDDNSLRITSLEGTWMTHKTGKPLFCMLHPAAILHKAPFPDEQKVMKTKVWKYIQEFRDEWKNKTAA
jgi:uracil-DNA glycosylase family 4